MMMPRAEYAMQHGAIIDKINENTARLDQAVATTKGRETGLTSLGLVAGDCRCFAGVGRHGGRAVRATQAMIQAKGK